MSNATSLNLKIRRTFAVSVFNKSNFASKIRESTAVENGTPPDGSSFLISPNKIKPKFVSPSIVELVIFTELDKLVASEILDIKVEPGKKIPYSEFELDQFVG